MAYAIWSDTEQAAERLSEPDTLDTESLLAEVGADSPILYAIPALSATEDGPAEVGESAEDGGQDDPAEKQFLDGLTLAGLVHS
jgi:hypothetical protein